MIGEPRKHEQGAGVANHESRGDATGLRGRHIPFVEKDR